MSLYLLAASKLSEVTDHSDIGIVVATGLILVFGVLILLYLLITLEGVIFSFLDKNKKGKTGATQKPAAPQKAAAPKPKAAPAPAIKAEQGIPGEVVAAISAAIACMDGGRYSVRSIARAQKKGRNVWSDAAVASYTQPF